MHSNSVYRTLNIINAWAQVSCPHTRRETCWYVQVYTMPCMLYYPSDPEEAVGPFCRCGHAHENRPFFDVRGYLYPPVL